MTESPDFLRDAVSRRTFLARMTAAGLGTAAAVLIAGCGGSSGGGGNSAGYNPPGLTVFYDKSNFPGIPGADENTVVLNFALTLETLEADLYRQALNLASGKALTTPLPMDVSGYTLSGAFPNGGLDTSSPGSLGSIGYLYLQQYAGVEAAHRDFLRAYLGPNGVPANPKGYNLGANPPTNLLSLLQLIRKIEETGVTAYLGAAGFLTDPMLVQIASSIYTTEARHSSGMNYILGLPTGPTGDVGGKQPAADVSPDEFEYSQTPSAILSGVRTFFN